MKMKIIAVACASVMLFASSFAANAQTVHPSATHAQRCELGSTCSLPDGDSDLIYFPITAKDGFTYQCNVHSDTGKLRFVVTSGKDFHINTGDDVYTVDPDVTVNIVGYFKNPADENDAGQIKFVKMTGDVASVTCHAAS